MQPVTPCLLNLPPQPLYRFSNFAVRSSCRRVADSLFPVFLSHLFRRRIPVRILLELLRASTLAPQPAKAHAASLWLVLLDVVAPALPHRRSRAVQTQQIPQFPDFRMVPRVLHTMHPGTLALLKNELPAHLLHVAALGCVPACTETLEDRLHRVDEHVRVHVRGLCA